jgi:transcriptional regulator with XRE-family HTH domain
MLNMDNLVKKLETFRLEHKVTQQTLAEQLGVSFVTVNRWLTGKTTPRKIQQYHIEKLIQKTSNLKGSSHAR